MNFIDYRVAVTQMIRKKLSPIGIRSLPHSTPPSRLFNTYIHTYIHTYIRTSRKQYVPHFFKVGGIKTVVAVGGASNFIDYRVAVTQIIRKKFSPIGIRSLPHSTPPSRLFNANMKKGRRNHSAIWRTNNIQCF